MLTLSADDLPPSPDDAQSMEPGEPTDASVQFAVWLARDGDRRIKVRISTRELSRLSGVPFGIASDKVRRALLDYREHLQATARAKHVAGANVVTLDVGDL